MKKISLILVFIFILASCKNDNEEQSHGEGGHNHGPDPVSYTMYEKNSELFVEFKPLTVGSTSRFAAHLTKLKGFKPVTEGQVSVSLIKDGKGLRHKVDSASSPGIFRLALTPKDAGIYTLIFDVKTPEFFNRFTIRDVVVYADEKKALADQKTEEPGDEVIYLKEQAWKTEFANTLVESQRFNEIIKSTGQIVPAPGDEATITAKADGIIRFNSGKLIGSAVGQGEGLFILTAGGLSEGSVETRYTEASNNLQRSKADFERAQELVKDKIISEKDFQEREARYQNDLATYKALAGNYSSEGLKLVSPIKGFIKSIYVSEGQFVDQGQPVATISQNKKLILRAEVFQKDFGKIDNIISANFKNIYENKIYNIDSLGGKLVSFGRNTENSYSIPVNFELDNKGEFIPGSFVDVFLRTKTTQQALVIPTSSLLEEQGKFYVYVQTAGESFEKREVKLGGTEGNNIEVLSGVNEGERVVSKGAFQIKLATMSGTLPAHGHEH